jgi:transposase
MSFPRAGKVCAAQILAELGDVRARFPTEDQLAIEAGVAPGHLPERQGPQVGWRWACDKRLRAALTCVADNSRHQSPWAIRILARAWVCVLWRAGTSYEPYDPA